MTLITKVVALALAVGALQGRRDACPTQCRCTVDTSDVYVEVDCSSFDFYGFPADVPKQIVKLNLSNNLIQVLPVPLGDFPLLEELDLTDNRINNLKDNVFFGLPKLKTLLLSRNSIQNVGDLSPSKLLSNLTSLRHLSLSHNEIRSFGVRGQVFNSSSLQILDLSNTLIEKLEETQLDDLSNLKTLDLSHSTLKMIRNVRSQTLEILDISFCDIDSFSSHAFQYLKSLKVLRATGNAQLNVIYLESNSLEELHAGKCNIHHLRFLEGLPNLTRLNLEKNQLEYISPYAFEQNSQLKYLDLSNNNIKSIQKNSFDGLRQLIEIDLSHNEIIFLPSNAFEKCLKLESVNISSNEIEYINNVNGKDIKHLDASHCKIRQIPLKTFENLPSLHSLNLSHNDISSISGSLHSLSLQYLDLSYCRVSMVDNTSFSSAVKLREIRLSGNRLTSTPKPGVFNHNKYLRRVWLDDNPWNCDCESPDFRLLWTLLAEGMSPLLEDQRSVRCTAPDTAKGLSWEDACRDQWYPLPDTRTPLQRYGTAVLVTVLCLGVAALVAMAVRNAVRKRRRKAVARERDLLRQNRELQNRLVRSVQALEEVADMREMQMLQARPREPSLPPTYEEAVQMSRSSEQLAEDDARPSTSRPRSSSESSASSASSDK